MNLLPVIFLLLAASPAPQGPGDSTKLTTMSAEKQTALALSLMKGLGPVSRTTSAKGSAGEERIEVVTPLDLVTLKLDPKTHEFLEIFRTPEDQLAKPRHNADKGAAILQAKQYLAVLLPREGFAEKPDFLGQDGILFDEGLWSASWCLRAKGYKLYEGFTKVVFDEKDGLHALVRTGAQPAETFVPEKILPRREALLLAKKYARQYMTGGGISVFDGYLLGASESDLYITAPSHPLDPPIAGQPEPWSRDQDHQRLAWIVSFQLEVDPHPNTKLTSLIAVGGIIISVDAETGKCIGIEY